MQSPVSAWNSNPSQFLGCANGMRAVAVIPPTQDKGVPTHLHRLPRTPEWSAVVHLSLPKHAEGKQFQSFPMHALALMWAQNENSFQGLEVQLSLAKLSVASFQCDM
jgi:hypothetical protein